MSSPRRLWWSFLWTFRWSVSWLMRCVSSATCTSGDPVSVPWTLYSVIVVLLSGMQNVRFGKAESCAPAVAGAPFDGSSRFAEVPPELRVTRTCRIPLSELEWRFTASGGPGGQHANTSNTRAEVRFDVANSPSIGPRQRARLLHRLGPVVRVVASDERSQTRNRELALDRLSVRLADALHVERTRVATRPSLGARKNRLESKRRRSDTKRLRGRPADDG